MASSSLSEIYRISSTGQVHLRAGRQKTNGFLQFPKPAGAEAEFYDEVELPNIGTLWSYTVQRFCPKDPYVGTVEGFTPYAVGYVEFPIGLVVETRIAVQDFKSLRIGVVMKAILAPFARADGTIEMIPVFCPINERSGHD
jgi:uncharacterized protein